MPSPPSEAEMKMAREIDLPSRLRLMSAFLRGEIEMKGAWFGDNADGERGKFWWRKYLPLTEAADEIASLRARVAELEGALRDGLDHLNWINAQAENAMDNVATVIASNEDGNVSLMMIDSIASDIGINAMMFADKARSALSAAANSE